MILIILFFSNYRMNIFINNRYRKIYTDERLFYVIYKKNKINITKYFKKNGVIKKEYKHLIHQKSKKVGGTGDKLVLCSFNVFTWSGYESYPINFDNEFKKLISEDLERGFNRFKKGLGRIVVKIEDEFN